MTTGKAWTQEEIELLGKHYKEGRREKEIAKTLSRTLSSVSKKIDALNLRKLHGHERKLTCPQWAALKLKEPTQQGKFYLPNLPWEPKILEIPRSAQGIKDLDFNWVSLNDSILWLKSINIDVRRTSYKTSPFICDGKYLTEGQVLFLCNKYRLQQGMPVMHIFGITEID